MTSYNLEHPSCHEAGYGRVHSVPLLELDQRTGMDKTKYVKRRISGSLTFAAGATCVDLPNAVLRAKEVAQAILEGRLVVMAKTPEVVPVAPAVPTAPAPSASDADTTKKAGGKK